MDDAFRLTAAKMPPARHVSPFGVRIAVTGALIASLSLSFAMFVVGQQRAADERRAAAAASQAAAHSADVQGLVPGEVARHVEASKRVVRDMLDARAQAAARSALDGARALASTRSMEAAVAGALSGLNHDVVFVDGTSTGPSVVSVFASSTGWSAAVQGSPRTCYWVALSAGGDTRYGTGSPCTGMAALAADRAAW